MATRESRPGGRHPGRGQRLQDSVDEIPVHLQHVFIDVEPYRRFRRLQAWIRRRRPYRDVEQVEVDTAIDYLDSPIWWDGRLTDLRHVREVAR